MIDYVDRNQTIATLSILEVNKPGADLRDARRAIADLPEPSGKDKLRYALEVIRDECEKHHEHERKCPLFQAREIGSICIISGCDPCEWEPEKMIHENQEVKQ